MEKRKDLITEREWVKEFWDPERNGCDIRILEGLRPNTHKKFWFKCPDCGYRFPKPICPRDISGVLLCPNCGEGRSREVTQENCLAATHPQIAGELADELNGGITGRTIRSTYRDHPLYFRCGRGHVYPAYVDNRARRGDGCPVCSRQKRLLLLSRRFCFTSENAAEMLETASAFTVSAQISCWKTGRLLLCMTVNTTTAQ